MSESHQSSAAQPKGLPRWVTVILSLAILVGGAGAAAYFVKTRPAPKKQEEQATAIAVHVHSVQVGARPVAMRLQGTVMPARTVVLQPEVNGRVLWHHAELVPGGFVKEGEPLVRIDPRDYGLAVEQQQAQIAQQQLALDLERSQQKVAQREWELFREQAEMNGGTTAIDPLPGPLASRQPHVKSAEVAVRSAQSRLAQAQLQLSRTTLQAPFNAFVRTENAEIGQLVGPSTQLATLVGTDAFWVQVTVPLDKLRFIELPEGDAPGSAATVSVDAGDSRVERTGRVIRLLGDLDPVARMARVMVEVQDPFGLRRKSASSPTATVEPRGDEQDKTASALPLLLGTFVDVKLDGATIDDVIELPRQALQPNDEVFVVGGSDQLEMKPVEVVWGGPETVFVRGALRPGDRVILTPLQAPVAGMRLKVSEGAPSTTAAAPRPVDSASATP